MSKALDELEKLMEIPAFTRKRYGVDKPDIPDEDYYWNYCYGYYEESDKAFRERIELNINKEK